MLPDENRILRPVILPVPEEVRQWHPRQRVKFLSSHARKALRVSAAKSKIELGVLAKNKDGAPLPSNGHYWSLTHKELYVAAVAAPHPVGIDVEKIESLHDGMYQRVAGESEWGLVSGDSQRRKVFFRFWTAKEAVMKAAGTGIKDLSRIKIRQILDHETLVLAFRDKSWKVVQCCFDSHIAAITANDCEVEWLIL